MRESDDLRELDKKYFPQVDCEDNLYQALKSTRDEATFIPLEKVAEIMKDVFAEEELEALKKDL